jgi:hypothetical protein
LKKGLTLLELLLAFSLMTIAVVTLSGLFLHLLTAGSKRSDLTVGRVFAESVLEDVIKRGLYATSSGDLEQGLYSHDASTQQTFFYRLTSEQAPCPAPSTRQGYLLEVEVWWWSGGPDQFRAQMGATNTRLQRWLVP